MIGDLRSELTGVTSEESGDNSSTDTLDDESTGDPVGPISYCSDLYVGGYDRVNLWRRDEDSDTCTLIRLIHYDDGWDGPTLEIDNADFAVERIVLQSGAEQCGTNSSGSVFAVAAAGSITLPMMWVPEVVDVDATLSFDPTEPWIVPEVAFQIEGLVPDFTCQDPSHWIPGTS